ETSRRVTRVSPLRGGSPSSVTRRPGRVTGGGVFFFQAEDGIRDGHVTGVQTCALPIWTSWWRPACFRRITEAMDRAGWAAPRRRSEERRVGKECRSRRSPQY